MAKSKRSTPRIKAPVRVAGGVSRKSDILSSAGATKCGQRPSPRTTRCRSVEPTETKCNEPRFQERTVATVYSAQVTHGYTAAATAAATDTISEASTKSPSVPMSVVSRRTSTDSEASYKDGPASVQPAGAGKALRLVGVKLHQRATETHIPDKLGCADSVTNSSGRAELRNNIGNSRIRCESRRKEFTETGVYGAGTGTSASNTVRVYTDSKSPHRQSHVAKVSTADDAAQDSQRLLQMLQGRQSDTDDTRDQQRPQHRMLLWRQQIQRQPEGEGQQQTSYEKQGRERYKEHRRCEQRQREQQHQYVHKETVTEKPQECSRGKAQASGERYTIHEQRCSDYGSRSETAGGSPPIKCLRERPFKTPVLGTEADGAGLSRRWERSGPITPAQAQVKELFKLLEPPHSGQKPSLPEPWSNEEKCALSVNLPLLSGESGGNIRRRSCENSTSDSACGESAPQPLQIKSQSHLWGFAHRLDHILDKLLQSQRTSSRDGYLCAPDSDAKTIHPDVSVRPKNTQDLDILKTTEDSRGNSGKANACDPVRTTSNGLSHSHFTPMFDFSGMSEQTAQAVDDRHTSTTGGAPAVEEGNNKLRKTREVGHNVEKSEEDLRRFIEQHTSAHCFAISRDPCASPEGGTRVKHRETKQVCFSPRRVVAQAGEAGAAGMPLSSNVSTDMNKRASRSSEREESVASCHTLSIREGLAFRSCHADEAREVELQDCPVNGDESDCSSHSLDGENDVGEVKRLMLVRQARMFPAVRGVYFDTRSGNLSWRCSWKTDGKKRSRSWSVLKFGMEGARAYAIAERLRHHSKACHTDDVARDFLRCFQTKPGTALRCRRSDTESPAAHALKTPSDSQLPSAASMPETGRRAETNSLKSSFSYYAGQLHSRDTLRQPPSPSSSTMAPGAKATSNFNTTQPRSPRHTSPRGMANEAASSDHGPERLRRAPVQTNTSQRPRDIEHLGVVLRPQLSAATPACSSLTREDNGNSTRRQAAGAPPLLDSPIDPFLTTRESSNANASSVGTSCDTGQAPADGPASFALFSKAPASPEASRLFASLVSRLNSFSSTNETGNCDFSTTVQHTLPPSSGHALSPRESSATAESILEDCPKRRKVQLYPASPVLFSSKESATTYLPFISAARQLVSGACILSCPNEVQKVSVPQANKNMPPDIVAGGKQLSHRCHHGYAPPGRPQTFDSSAACPSVDATTIRYAEQKDTSAMAARKATSVESNERIRGGEYQGYGSQEEEKKDLEERQAGSCNKGAGACKIGRETSGTPGKNNYSEEHLSEEEARSQSSSRSRGWHEMPSKGELAPPATAAPTATLLSRAISMCMPAAAALRNSPLAAPSASLPSIGRAAADAEDSIAAAIQKSDWTGMQESVQHQDASGCESAPAGGAEGAQTPSQEKLKNSTSLKSSMSSNVAEREGIEGESMKKEICRGGGGEEGTEASTGHAGEENANANRSRWRSQCSMSGAIAAESPGECCWRALAQERLLNSEEGINPVQLWGRDRIADSGAGVTDKGQCDVRSGTGKPAEVDGTEEQRRAHSKEELHLNSATAAVSVAHVSINSLAPTGVDAMCHRTDTSIGGAGQLVSLNEASDGPLNALLGERAPVGTPTGIRAASDTRHPVVSSEHLHSSTCLLTNALGLKVVQYSGDVPASRTGNHVVSSSHQHPLASECSAGQEALHGAGLADEEKVLGEDAHVQGSGDTGKARSKEEGTFCHASSHVPAVLSGCAAPLSDAAATDKSEGAVEGSATILRDAEGPQTSASASPAAEGTECSESRPPHIAPGTTTATLPVSGETAVKVKGKKDILPFEAVEGQDDRTLSMPGNEAVSLYVLSSTEDLLDSVRKRWDACSGKFVSVETDEERTGNTRRLSIDRLLSQRVDPPSAWKYWRNVTAATAVPLPNAIMTKTYYDDTPTTAPSPTTDDSSTEGNSAAAGGPSPFEKGKSVSFPAESGWEEDEEGCSPVILSDTPLGVKEDGSQKQRLRSSDHGETVGERQDTRDRTTASSTNEGTPDAWGEANGRGNGEDVTCEGLDFFGRKDAFTTYGNFRNDDYLKNTGRLRNGVNSNSSSSVQSGGGASENSIRRVVLVEALLKLKESLVELLQLSSRSKASIGQESTENPAVNLPLLLLFSHGGDFNALQRRKGRSPACSAEAGALDGESEIQGKTATWCVEIFDELLDTLRLGVGPRDQRVLGRRNESEGVGDESEDVANRREKADAFCRKWEKDSPASVDELENTAFLLLSGFLRDIFSAPALMHYKKRALLAALITCFLDWKRLQNS